MYRLSPPDISGSAAWGLLAVRLVAGAGIAIHGWPKIQHSMTWMGPQSPIPSALQALAAVAEFGGGLCWIFGILTVPASFLILCTMAVAAGMVHIANGHPFVASPPSSPSYETAALYFAIALLLLLAGPGRLSLGWLLTRPPQNPALADSV